MAKKVFNMEGGLHSANAFTAFEARAYGSCVASPTSLKVVPASGMTVRVSVGDGIIDGQTPRRVQIDAVENITLTPASTSYARKDLIVAYIDSSVSPTTSVVDNTNNLLKFVAVNGTPSAVPATPSSGEIQAKIGAGNQYMILAEITVAQSAVSILENAISDKRNVITIVPVESLSGKITGSQIESSTIGANNINFATFPAPAEAIGPNSGSGSGDAVLVSLSYNFVAGQRYLILASCARVDRAATGVIETRLRVGTNVLNRFRTFGGSSMQMGVSMQRLYTPSSTSTESVDIFTSVLSGGTGFDYEYPVISIIPLPSAA